MHRIDFINKNTGDIKPIWIQCSKDGEYKGFEDLDCTVPIDMTAYTRLQDDESLCPTPFNMFGIECGKGWYPLIKKVIDYIDAYNSNVQRAEERITITQIKEKWARLEIYVSKGTKELYELIDEVGDESETVCEYCGSKTNIGCTVGYYQTLCYDCVKEMVNQQNFGAKQWLCYEDDSIYWVNPHKPDKFIKTSKHKENTKNENT